MKVIQEMLGSFIKTILQTLDMLDRRHSIEMKKFNDCVQRFDCLLPKEMNVALDDLKETLTAYMDDLINVFERNSDKVLKCVMEQVNKIDIDNEIVMEELKKLQRKDAEKQKIVHDMSDDKTLLQEVKDEIEALSTQTLKEMKGTIEGLNFRNDKDASECKGRTLER